MLSSTEEWNEYPMSNLKRLSVLLIICGAITACSGRVPTNGFKDLRYGMSLDELRTLGFDCQATDYYCQRQASDDERYTLFGKEASVGVDTANGRLVAISVSIDMPSDELISLYTQEFGEPQTFTYPSLGGQSERYYWHSGDRAAISVTRSVTGGERFVLGVPRSHVDYLGPEETQELLEEASDNTVRSQDY